MYRIFYLCVAVCVTVLGSGWCLCCAETPLQTPTLSDIIFIGLWPIKELDPTHYPKEGRPCLKNYLAAIAPDSSLWAFKPPSTSEKAALVRMRVLAEQMVAILGQEVRAEAEAFAYSVPLVSEWEGMSEGPVEEANFVDDWLSKRPGRLSPRFSTSSKHIGSEWDTRLHGPGMRKIYGRSLQDGIGRQCTRPDHQPNH